MDWIILINHSSRDIWNIASCVRLAGHVDFKILNAEDGFEVQEEVDEVLGNILFVGGSDFSN